MVIIAAFHLVSSPRDCAGILGWGGWRNGLDFVHGRFLHDSRICVRVLIAWVMFAGALMTGGFRVERGERRLEWEVKGLRHESISGGFSVVIE